MKDTISYIIITSLVFICIFIFSIFAGYILLETTHAQTVSLGVTVQESMRCNFEKRKCSGNVPQEDIKWEEKDGYLTVYVL